MAITGTSIDYSGRQLDMYISGSLNPLITDAQKITYSFGTPSKYIAGVQKLIQRYLISLSNSGLIEALMGSVNNNIQEAVHTFNFYSWDVIQAFRAYQNNNQTAPLDEQLATVQITNVTSAADQINFSLQLITKAGNNVAFVLPLPLI